MMCMCCFLSFVQMIKHCSTSAAVEHTAQSYWYGSLSRAIQARPTPHSKHQPSRLPKPGQEGLPTPSPFNGAAPQNRLKDVKGLPTQRHSGTACLIAVQCSAVHVLLLPPELCAVNPVNVWHTPHFCSCLLSKFPSELLHGFLNRTVQHTPRRITCCQNSAACTPSDPSTDLET